MKKGIILAVLLLSTIVLSGCDYKEKDHFAFYNGYKDEEINYFDEYAIVYQNNEYNLTLYAVRDEEILDSNGDEFVNYIMDWDVTEVSTLLLSCGYYNLYRESKERNLGGMNSHLIPGQEIYDYCTDYDTLKLSLPNEEEVTIQLYRDINSDDIEWKEVSSINENNVAIFVRDNSSAILYVSLAIIITAVLSIGYTVIYRRNYNNFTKGLKVRKLLRLGTVNALLVILLAFASIIIIQENKPLIHRYESNFYDYELREDSVDYLPVFDNDGYTLIESQGNQELYIQVESNDKMTYYIILVDGDDRYVMDEFLAMWPEAGISDDIRVELFQKETNNSSFIFAYIVSQYIDGAHNFSYWHGVMRNIAGEVIFVDFLDSDSELNLYDGWYEYYKNAKGYYRVYIERAKDDIAD